MVDDKTFFSIEIEKCGNDDGQGCSTYFENDKMENRKMKINDLAELIFQMEKGK